MTTLVTTYHNPDLDGFSCAIAYAEFLNMRGQDAVPGIFGEPHLEVRYVMERFGFPYPATVLDPQAFDKIVLCDASKPADLDPLLDPGKVVEIIDHREITELAKFPNAKSQIELIGAAATLVAERLRQSGYTPSRMAAILLYGGIISNSLNFKAPFTSDRDRAAAAWLNSIANLPPTFAADMFRAKSDLAGPKLEKVMRDDYQDSFAGGKKLGIGQIEMVGSEDLVAARKPEILRILGDMEREEKLDYVYIAFVDLEKGYDIFVTDDAATQSLLSTVLGVVFTDNEARTDGILMRKQICPRLKAHLEAHAG